MPRDVEQQLARFEPDDVTVRLCGTVLGVAAAGVEMTPYADLAEVIVSLGLDPAHAGLAEAVRDRAAADGPQRALWIVDAMDTGNHVLTVYTGVKTAYQLYRARAAQSTPAPVSSDAEDTPPTPPPPLPIDHRQAEDAVLKALGLGYLAHHLFEGSPSDRARALLALPSGKALVAWYASVEVALPFVSDARQGRTHFVEHLFESVGDAESERLAALVGPASVAQAARAWSALQPGVELLVEDEARRLASIAEVLGGFLAMLAKAATHAATVAAHGADVAPVYRYLGARVAAEAVVVAAARGLGLEPMIPGDADFDAAIDAIDAAAEAGVDDQPVPADEPVAPTDADGSGLGVPVTGRLELDPADEAVDDPTTDVAGIFGAPPALPDADEEVAPTELLAPPASVFAPTPVEEAAPAPAPPAEEPAPEPPPPPPPPAEEPAPEPPPPPPPPPAEEPAPEPPPEPPPPPAEEPPPAPPPEAPPEAPPAPPPEPPPAPPPEPNEWDDDGPTRMVADPDRLAALEARLSSVVDTPAPAASAFSDAAAASAPASRASPEKSAASPPARSGSQPPAKKKKRGCLGGCLSVLLVLFVLGGGGAAVIAGAGAVWYAVDPAGVQAVIQRVQDEVDGSRGTPPERSRPRPGVRPKR